VRAEYVVNGNLWLAPNGTVYQAHQTDTGAAVWSLVPTPALPADAVVNAVTAATVVSGGTGYATNDTLTMPNGTVLKVTAQSGGVISTVSVLTAGSWQCYTSQAQSQLSTSGSGSGATFTLTANWPLAVFGNHVMTACYGANKWADFQRASDSATITLGYVNSVADVQSLQAFCAGTTCTWQKWYDQSGYGNNATPGSTAPLVDFGHTLNGIPVVFGESNTGYMTIGSGLVTSTPGITAYMLTRSECEGCGLYHFVIGTSGAYGVFTSLTNINQQFNSVGDIYQTPYYPGFDSELIGGTITSTSSASYSANDFEWNCASGCAASYSLNSADLGNSNNSGLGASAFVIWPRSFSSAERTAFKAAMYKTYNVAPQQRALYVASGDSRTASQNSTNGNGYPSQFENIVLKPGRVYDNLNITAESGWNMTNVLAQFYATAGPAALMSTPHDSDCWGILWMGYNDIASGGSPSTAYTNMTTYISQVHALGCKVMIANEIEYPSGQSASLTTLQGLILANTGGADVVANFANDPVWLGGSGGTYGYTSQTFAAYPHPTTFGYGYVANDFANAINPIFK
jgi:hypothetical protein